jgi:hypothetical protein
MNCEAFKNFNECQIKKCCVMKRLVVQNKTNLLLMIFGFYRLNMTTIYKMILKRVFAKGFKRRLYKGQASLPNAFN